MGLKQFLFRNTKLEKSKKDLQRLQDEIKSATYFINSLADGDLSISYPRNKLDIGGNISLSGPLLSLQKKLLELNDLEEQRKWSSEGLSKLVEILKQQHTLKEMCFKVISNIIVHVKAIQGNIYIVDHERRKLYLNACYAYDRKKVIKQHFDLNENMIGQVVQDKKSKILSDVPEGYVKITSGLGTATPRCIAIVPLISNNKVHGVIEIASFNEFQPYHIHFLEKFGEYVASSIVALTAAEKTEKLLQMSREQSEEMRMQEEQLLQSMEQMQYTQKRLAKKEAESKSLLKALDAAYYVAELDNEGVILTMNELFVQLLYKNSIKDHIGRYYASDIQSDKKTLSEVMTYVLSGETVMRTAYFDYGNGKMWFYETFSPVFDGNGEITKILLIAADITYNKEQEIELRNVKEQLFQNMMDIRQKNISIEESNLRLKNYRKLPSRLIKEEAIRKGDWQEALKALLTTISIELKIGRVGFWKLGECSASLKNEALFLLAEENYITSEDTLNKINFPDYLDMIKNGEVVSVNDVYNDKLISESVMDNLKKENIGAMLMAPIFYENQLKGIICCEHLNTPRDWQEEEIDMVVLVSDITSNVLGMHLYNLQKKNIESDVTEQKKQNELLKKKIDGIVGVFKKEKGLRNNKIRDKESLIEKMNDIHQPTINN